MKIKVVGDGAFGTFLKTVFADYLDEDAVNIFLAVPLTAYDEVAALYKGKHLINVCSVQSTSNAILKKHSDHITGIHPMFGPRSFANHKVCVVTRTTSGSQDVIDLFKSVGCTITCVGDIEHDEMMSKVHVPLIRIREDLQKIVDRAKDVPMELLPSSFMKLRDLCAQLKMSDGTTLSIMLNPFIDEN